MVKKEKKKMEDKMMSDESTKKEFNYEAEKKSLKRKITIFLVVTVAFTVLFQLTMSENVSFITNLSMGALFGIVFYIPGRLRDYFGLGWIMTIVIAVAYVLLLVFLNDKIGPVSFILLLLPIADMGYSIYKVVSYKKNNGEG